MSTLLLLMHPENMRPLAQTMCQRWNFKKIPFFGVLLVPPTDDPWSPRQRSCYVCKSALGQLFIPEYLRILAQTICSTIKVFLICPTNYFWPPCKFKICLRNVSIRFAHDSYIPPGMYQDSSSTRTIRSS